MTEHTVGGPNNSNSRIFLYILFRTLIKFIPGLASLMQRLVFVLCICHLTRSLQHLHPEALTRVPCNVTVNQPRSGIVSLVGKDHVSSLRPRRRVSPGRILQLQRAILCKVALASTQQEKVVAVQMHGVRAVALGNVIKDNVYPLVGSVGGMIEQVVWWKNGSVVLGHEQVGGLGPVDPEIRVVQSPHEAARHIVRMAIEIEDVSPRRRAGVDLDVRYELLSWLVVAIVGVMERRVRCVW